MELFRIALKKYSKSLLASGKAARWNMDNEFVIYTGSSRSLSTLEMLVNRKNILSQANYQIMVIGINYLRILEEEILVKSLPANWRTRRAYSHLQKTGSEWYRKQKSLLLKVPSVVIPQEFNYIINTTHPEFKKRVTLSWQEDYFWDKRLLKET